MKYTEVVEVKQVCAFQCDKCKKTVSKADDLMDFQEALHIDFVGGYGSVFGDGARVQCDLCQDCLKELITPFCKITP